MRPAGESAPLLEGWELGEMLFFASPFGFTSTAFTPVRRMLTRGGGAPDSTRGIMIFFSPPCYWTLERGEAKPADVRLSQEWGKCAVWENQTLENVECLHRIVFE